jgi:hypothetical protein
VPETAPAGTVLCGTCLARVLEMARECGLSVVERPPDPRLRHLWLEAFICNALRIAQPLSAIDCPAGTPLPCLRLGIPIRDCVEFHERAEEQPQADAIASSLFGCAVSVLVPRKCSSRSAAGGFSFADTAPPGLEAGWSAALPPEEGSITRSLRDKVLAAMDRTPLTELQKQFSV